MQVDKVYLDQLTRRGRKQGIKKAPALTARDRVADAWEWAEERAEANRKELSDRVEGNNTKNRFNAAVAVVYGGVTENMKALVGRFHLRGDCRSDSFEAVFAALGQDPDLRTAVIDERLSLDFEELLEVARLHRPLVCPVCGMNAKTPADQYACCQKHWDDYVPPTASAEDVEYFVSCYRRGMSGREIHSTIGWPSSKGADATRKAKAILCAEYGLENDYQWLDWRKGQR